MKNCNICKRLQRWSATSLLILAKACAIETYESTPVPGWLAKPASRAALTWGRVGQFLCEKVDPIAPQLLPVLKGCDDGECRKANQLTIASHTRPVLSLLAGLSVFAVDAGGEQAEEESSNDRNQTWRSALCAHKPPPPNPRAHGRLDLGSEAQDGRERLRLL